jgi:hypothetical protein
MQVGALTDGRRRHAAGARRIVVAAIGLASLVVGTIAAEATLIGPVVFLAGWLGFWPGLAAFTSSCVVFGLAMLWLTVRLWPERAARVEPEGLKHGPIRRLIGRVAYRSRPIGALAIAWYCGPFASPPMIRALGYRGQGLVLWVLVSGLLFGSFWFSVYGGGFQLVTGALT